VTRHRAGLLALAVVLGACRTSVRQAPASATLVPLFGPVIGAEVIAGRADAGDEIVLLVGGTDLVRISLAARRFERVRLRTDAGVECWNLASPGDGSLWTIRSRDTLARLRFDGSIVSEAALGEPYFGLFASENRLLFQRADFTPPGPALIAAGADGRPHKAWSTIATRAFPALARASAAALNMVTCGSTDSTERACWFPDEAAVFFVSADGSTRHVSLPGLDVVAPETLLTSDNPRRPVRDAYVDATGALWILSSGMPPPGAKEGPGGWLLARYDAAGVSKGIRRLSEAARLILRADGRNVSLVMAGGMVGQVPRW